MKLWLIYFNSKYKKKAPEKTRGSKRKGYAKNAGCYLFFRKLSL